jgi:large subunit ribosomal protein L18
MGTLNFRTRARLKRKKRIRKKLVGTTSRPRLCVFRSAKHIYAQLVDDSLGQTLVAASSMEKAVREVPDRNGFLYHGRVKAVSEGAREAGLKF